MNEDENITVTDGKGKEAAVGTVATVNKPKAVVVTTTDPVTPTDPTTPTDTRTFKAVAVKNADERYALTFYYDDVDHSGENVTV